MKFSFNKLQIILIFFLSGLSFNALAQHEITGKVVSEKGPLRGVNVVIAGTQKGTETGKDGTYRIQVGAGEKLQFSYVGYKTQVKEVPEGTGRIDVLMIPEGNSIGEVVVNSNQKGMEAQRIEKQKEVFSTSQGDFDPKKSGSAIFYVDGVQISTMHSRLSEALVGKVPGARIETTTGKFILKESTSINYTPAAIWEVDGVIYNDEPRDIDLNQIESVRILRSLASTNRYGSQAAGGVVVVKTKGGSYGKRSKGKKKTKPVPTNKNYYENDAVSIDTDVLSENEYTRTIASFPDKQKAFEYYNNEVKERVKEYDVKIGIARKFYSHFKAPEITNTILKELSNSFKDDPEVQKAVAYQFQEIKNERMAALVYLRVYKLLPEAAQSYRDLANSYVENDQYQKAWQWYMRYLLKGNQLGRDGIGEIIYNEMEWLYYNRKNQAGIKENFVPKSQSIADFRNDVRLVFEWNTIDADFGIEFVNPQQLSFTFEHNPEKNKNFIDDERKVGYGSKEFFIDKLDDTGDWLINFEFRSAKNAKPLYLKVTEYLNWSKPNQKTRVFVYHFKDVKSKIQLLKLNKASLKN